MATVPHGVEAPLRILVVGGLGFIGRELAGHAASLGWDVHVTTRRSPGSARVEPTVKVHWSVKRPSDLSAQGFDAVYYMPGRPGGPLGRLRGVHVVLAREWALWAAEQGARFVYMSSIAVTADFSSSEDSHGRIVEEDTHLSGMDPRRALTTHAQTKAEMESELVSGETGRALRGRFVIARPGLVYGPGAPHAEWRLLRVARLLRIVPDSRVIPVVSTKCLARFLAGLAETPRYDGAWVNLAEEDSRLRDAVERSLGPCPRCFTLDADRMARLARLAPRWSRARLSYSLARRGRPYASRLARCRAEEGAP